MSLCGGPAAAREELSRSDRVGPTRARLTLHLQRFLSSYRTPRLERSYHGRPAKHPLHRLSTLRVRRRIYLTDLLRRLSVSHNPTRGITTETTGAHIVCRIRCRYGISARSFASATRRRFQKGRSAVLLIRFSPHPWLWRSRAEARPL